MFMVALSHLKHKLTLLTWSTFDLNVMGRSAMCSEVTVSLLPRWRHEPSVGRLVDSFGHTSTVAPMLENWYSRRV